MESAVSKRPHLDIRRAGPGDVAAVRSLTRNAYAKWIAVIGREPLPMKANYEEAVREHEIDLLFADGDLVALIEVIPTADHLFIENIAVSPEQQGKGLGRHLMRLAEAKAKGAGLGELRLLTNQAFASNVRLYQSIGFRIDRTEPHIGGGTTVYMSKHLVRGES
ncbi:MAG: GNAT family N-acetyltransferase [Enhydrobacter sp.]|jgi:ribosomal protein S18 acetylase RimI-like enzyme|nr:GNAT family N-acetyltransferase [Enhydrobacter sp.]